MKDWYDTGEGSEKMKRELARDNANDPAPALNCQRCVKLKAKIVDIKKKYSEAVAELTELQHEYNDLEDENKRLRKEIIKPLLEGYCNMAGMLQTDFQFMGDQLTQLAEQALKGE